MGGFLAGLTSDAEYDAITAYFVEPEEEGLTIVRHAS